MPTINPDREGERSGLLRRRDINMEYMWVAHARSTEEARG